MTIMDEILKGAEVTYKKKKKTKKAAVLSKVDEPAVVNTNELDYMTELKDLCTRMNMIEEKMDSLDLTVILSRIENYASKLKGQILPNANASYRDRRDKDGLVTTDLVKVKKYTKNAIWTFSDATTKMIEVLDTAKAEEKENGKATKSDASYDYYKDRSFSVVNK